jgi:hypothetical protein
VKTYLTTEEARSSFAIGSCRFPQSCVKDFRYLVCILVRMRVAVQAAVAALAFLKLGDGFEQMHAAKIRP